MVRIPHKRKIEGISLKPEHIVSSGCVPSFIFTIDFQCVIIKETQPFLSSVTCDFLTISAMYYNLVLLILLMCKMTYLHVIMGLHCAETSTSFQWKRSVKTLASIKCEWEKPAVWLEAFSLTDTFVCSAIERQNPWSISDLSLLEHETLVLWLQQNWAHHSHIVALTIGATAMIGWKEKFEGGLL